MRYLRMLTNSLLAGLLAAMYLSVLILQLNPELPLAPETVGALLATLVVVYGVHVAVGCYGLIVVRELFSERLLSPGWLSLRLLVWLSAGSALAASVLMWINLRGFAVSLEPETGRRMAAGAAVVSVCSVLFLVIASVHYSFGRRGSRVSATLFALTVVASVGLPLVARGTGGGPPPAPRAAPRDAGEPAFEHGAAIAPRVVMVLLDGASLDLISLAVAEGHLPNFGRFIDAGAVMHVATLRPTQPAPVWTAVATGKLPPKNGVRSAARYRFSPGELSLSLLPDLCFAHALVRFGFLEEEPYASGALRARPIWNLLSDLGIPVGVIGWPLTHPVPALRGFAVSDRFHRRSEAFEPADRIGVFPAEAAATVLQAARSVPANAALPGGDPVLAAIDEVLQADLALDRIASALAQERPVQVLAVRFQSLDAAGHHLLRYAMPEAFGDVSEEERRQYGRLLERYYGEVDHILGRMLGQLGSQDLLMVVSGFGMGPLTLGKRLLERLLGDPRLAGTHEAAPDGFVLAYGPAVAPGRRPRGSLTDVLPTVLYFLGLPVARDMDGHARTDLFTPAFTTGRPITFIPTYER